MTPIELPFTLPGFQIDQISKHDDVIEVMAHAVEIEAICPGCQHCSRRVHSYYQRSPADLPISDYQVRLQLMVRRFRCQNSACVKQTFAERLPMLVATHAQRTRRLMTTASAVAFALGGRAGQRLAVTLHMPMSGDTLLRIIRRTPCPETEQPQIIGVDDWAQRRGRVYGTIVVDLERHRVVDLLSDRTAEILAVWLTQHPSVTTIARDRSGEYARGVALGAPQATQVLDRWHLLVNLREAFQKLLDRLRPELNPLTLAKPSGKSDEIRVLRRRHRSQQDVVARDGSRARALALHHQVHRLRGAGDNIQAIARHLKLSRSTVYRYLSMSEFPERAAPQARASILHPFVADLTEHWTAGERNASELWRAIQAKGYPGTRRQVAQWVAQRRERPSRLTPKKYLEHGTLARDCAPLHEAADRPPLPSARRLVWLFLKHTDQLEPAQLTLRDQLLTHPLLSQAKQLAQDFQSLIRKRKALALETWFKACEIAKIPELTNFASGLRQEAQAVTNAVSAVWSNGQTEGQVNKLKLLKRQMYGRANFDLLRLRALHST
jgi:transposase